MGCKCAHRVLWLWALACAAPCLQMLVNIERESGEVPSAAVHCARGFDSQHQLRTTCTASTYCCDSVLVTYSVYEKLMFVNALILFFVF